MKLLMARKWLRYVTFDGIVRRSFSDARGFDNQSAVKQMNFPAERLSI